MSAGRLTVAPSAARLTKSLRDVGYDFPAAVADLVDNSITAGAKRIEVLGNMPARSHASLWPTTDAV
jgi:hypothetical protein